jgi:Secretion system C-terminal sorting domain
VDDFIEVANTSSAIANKEGYFVFVRGDRSVGQFGPFAPTTLRIKGRILTGTQSGVGYNITSSTGFLSVGNPYPSQIDFKALANGNSSIVHSFYVWNPNANGSFNAGIYEVYVQDIAPPFDYKLNGSGAVRNTIESGQAFIIQSTTNGGIAIQESHKTAGSTLVSRAGVTVPTLEINLMGKDINGNRYKADASVINLGDGFSNNVDNLDVKKIMNTSDNLAIINSAQKLVVERRSKLTVADTIFLNLTNTRVASYAFEIDPSVLNNLGMEAFLVDKFLQSKTPLSLNDTTNINFDITTDVASKAADRFMIIFKSSITTSFTTIAASRNTDKTVTVKWGVANERNLNTYTVEQSNDGVNFTALAGIQAPSSNTGDNTNYTKQDATASIGNNWYRVKIVNQNGTSTYSAVALVGAQADAAVQNTASISIYPNPVVNGNVNLYLHNQVKGVYQVQVSNQLGQIIRTETVQVQNNSVVKTITIGNISKGAYQATVLCVDGNKIVVPFIIE